MNRTGRILVLDDLKKWREELSAILTGQGFYVDTAATATEALGNLSQTFYHLAILDIRLEDHDPSNAEGMNLLETLGISKLGGVMKVMMLSAYGTKDQMRKAFRDHDIIDFLDKTDFKGQEFLKQVQQFFSEQLRINLGLTIHWQDISKVEQAVLNLELNNKRIKRDTPDQVRAAQELDDLLCRLFYEADSLLVKPLTPGYSGASVLWAQPFYKAKGGAQPTIVKFGDFRKIEQEYQNFKAYIQPFIGGGRSTTVLNLRRTPQLGGIVYSLLGATGDRVEDFGSFYRRAEIGQIKEILDHLFWDTCGAWYDNPGQLQPHDLSKSYQDALRFTWDGLEQTLTKSLKSVQGKEKLHFTSLNSTRDFRNPILAAAKCSLIRPTYVCTTHGDFNERNILVDSAGHTWLIDFLYTGPSHILRDVVKLDTVIRFELLAAEDATLEERLAMEEALNSIEYFNQVEQLATAFTTENSALAKAYATAVHLRLIAKKLVVQNRNDDFSEYHIAALYHAINATRYYSLPSIQREHALLSASLLAERLGL